MGPLSSRDARIQAAWKADRAYLFAIAAGMLGRPAEAEDVVQEAFARLAELPSMTSTTFGMAGSRYPSAVP